MTFTHTPATCSTTPDTYTDETTGRTFAVKQDTSAEDPRTWIDDESAAVYVFRRPRYEGADETPDNLVAQAFARFFEVFDKDTSFAAVVRWLNIFHPDLKVDVAMQTVRGYSHSDWADVFAVVSEGYGTAQSHIDEYRMWAFGDVWTVTPEEDGDSLSGIYADDSEEAVKYYLEENPELNEPLPKPEPEHPEPDFVDNRIARWHTPDGAIITDRLNTLTKVFFYQKNDQTHEVEDPNALITAIRAAQNYTFDTKE